MGTTWRTRAAALIAAGALASGTASLLNVWLAPAIPADAASGLGVTVQQNLINQDRAAASLGVLNWSDCLAAVAVQNAQRIMAQGYLSHTNGPTLDMGCGVSAYHGGENIAYMSGGINDAQANTMFMNSPPHKANILGSYQYVATAWAVAPNGYAYIAEEFLGASNIVVPNGLHPLAPARILDTRTGLGTVAGARLVPGGVLTVTVAGQGGLPSSGLSAVVLNVTVTNTNSAGYLTVYPQEDPRPNASNLNWTAGQTVPNLVQVAVRGSGQLNIYNAAGYGDVIFDVAGYVPPTTAAPGPDGLYNSLVPARILNWGGDEAVSPQEWCPYLAELAGVEATFVLQEIPGSQRGVVLDVTRRLAVTSPCSLTWREGMRAMLEARYPDGVTPGRPLDGRALRLLESSADTG